MTTTINTVASPVCEAAFQMHQNLSDIRQALDARIAVLAHVVGGGAPDREVVQELQREVRSLHAELQKINTSIAFMSGKVADMGERLVGTGQDLQLTQRRLQALETDVADAARRLPRTNCCTRLGATLSSGLGKIKRPLMYAAAVAGVAMSIALLRETPKPLHLAPQDLMLDGEHYYIAD